jgi:hypothetical protein
MFHDYQSYMTTFQLNSIQKMPKDNFFKELQELPPIPDFYHYKYCWRILKTWIILPRRMKIQGSYKVRNQHNIVHMWWYFHFPISIIQYVT